MFEHRTEVTGGLSVNPQSFSEVNNGQKRTFFVRVNTDMVHSEIAPPPKIIQCHRNKTILQLRERGITNYEAQLGVLALAP